ncbi:aldose 1-epimerase [Novosphingobium jiangmenense]|uniref:Aldose 1-epimerase n=1 Tax=Novosphingobium jiangmenense TaxID=2791981 RepID=A0ABS0HJA0_9SPHN|nr:aldose 1-epimerase [Novosphingobium jiangmenense]MBF9152327.1 aldose 1-epimerase [Novosphingobium jiangmenense]
MNNPQTWLLSGGDYEVTVAPEIGGSLRSLDWKGLPVFREAPGDHILDAACFPLVPFCNRIAHGMFTADGVTCRLSPNFPGPFHPHALHGHGWLVPWQVASHDSASIRMVYDHSADEWPWRYHAEQHVQVSVDGVRITLSVTNTGQGVMPAGLGLHPYFPRDDNTIYLGLHRREWQTAPDGLPIAPLDAAKALDWWHGAPIGSRPVDTIQDLREGALTIRRTAHDLLIELLPCDAFSCTGVYVPPDADFFCIEPLTHPTDAVNRAPDRMTMLAEGETLEASLLIRARHISSHQA